MEDFYDNKTFIKRLRKGDERAYVFLINQYHTRLYAYSISLAHDPEIAQDIVQNVYMKTWSFRKKLKSEFPIQTFLYRLVYNEFINQYNNRKSTMLLQKRYIDALDDFVVEDDSSKFATYVAQVKKEIQNLPPKCKEVFIMSKQEGLTNLEISDYLNISIKTVEGQISKAYSILRKNVKRDLDGILFILFGEKIVK
jgi:RNA polymerase sigma-70 factor (ECF subfamily)